MCDAKRKPATNSNVHNTNAVTMLYNGAVYVPASECSIQNSLRELMAASQTKLLFGINIYECYMFEYYIMRKV